MVVAIEHDQTGESRLDTAPLAEVRRGARRLTASEDDGVALDAARELGIEAARPGLEDLPIPRPLDVEHEAVLPSGRPAPALTTARSRSGALGASMRLSAKHEIGLSVTREDTAHRARTGIRSTGLESTERTALGERCHLRAAIRPARDVDRPSPNIAGALTRS